MIPPLRAYPRAVDLAHASFALAALAFALAGSSGTLNLALAAVVLFAVRRLDVPHPHDISIVVAAALLAWGSALHLYSRVPYYDLVAHSSVQLLIAPAAYVLLAQWGLVPMPGAAEPHRLGQGIIVVTLALGLGVGALWEVTEWSLDGLAGTALIEGTNDTFTDLVADGIGAALGGAWLAVSARRLEPLGERL